jgi:hypothetical protein
MEMKKLLALGFLSLFMGSQAHAGFIGTITGADMAGIEVTATFSDGSANEELVWSATDAVSGGVTGSDWSLTQSGETFGEFDGVNVIGAWILSSANAALESVIINLGSGFVFDTEFGDASANGSGPGREFVSSTPIGSEFGGLVQDELFSTLTLSDFGTGEVQFLIDTDQVTVNAPATLSLILLALGGLAMRRKKA